MVMGLVVRVADKVVVREWSLVMGAGCLVDALEVRL